MPFVRHSDEMAEIRERVRTGHRMETSLPANASVWQRRTGSAGRHSLIPAGASLPKHSRLGDGSASGRDSPPPNSRVVAHLLFCNPEHLGWRGQIRPITSKNVAAHPVSYLEQSEL